MPLHFIILNEHSLDSYVAHSDCVFDKHFFQYYGTVTVNPKKKKLLEALAGDVREYRDYYLPMDLLFRTHRNILKKRSSKDGDKLKALDMAYKQYSGIYEPERWELTGKDGGPIEVSDVPVEPLRLKDLLKKLKANRKKEDNKDA